MPFVSLLSIHFHSRSLLYLHIRTQRQWRLNIFVFVFFVLSIVFLPCFGLCIASSYLVLRFKSYVHTSSQRE